MEPLLNQLVSGVAELYPDIDLMQVKVKFAGFLALYDIKPAKLQIVNPDISGKVKLFLSAKKLDGLSPLTLTGYAIELRILGKYIQKPVAQINTNDIREYLSRFDNLKTSSKSRKISVLKSFFGWLSLEEIIDKDPMRKIKNPKKEKRLPKALTIEELEMIRESCQSLRERALIEVFYATGGRLSEIQNLNRQDIDWQNMTAVVFGKGAKERDVFFSWKAIYHLKKYLASREDAVPALFITERRPYRRLSNRGIQRAVKIIARKASLENKLHPHVLRHTFASLTLNNGADLVAIQELLGHENPATTQIYAQLSPRRKKEQYRKYLVQ